MEVPELKYVDFELKDGIGMITMNNPEKTERSYNGRGTVSYKDIKTHAVIHRRSVLL